MIVLLALAQQDKRFDLALWLDNCQDHATISVYDPDRELPASQASWVEADRA